MIGQQGHRMVYGQSFKQLKNSLSKTNFDRSYYYMANRRGHNLVITWKIRSFVESCIAWSKPDHYLEKKFSMIFFNPLFWLYGLPLISYAVTIWFRVKRN